MFSPISLSQLIPNEADKYISHHWVEARLPNNRHLVHFTGIVIPHVYGAPDMSLTEGPLTLTLSFPALTPALAREQAFWIEYWSPFFTISAIHKGGDNHYGGWGVDEFGVDVRNRKVTDHVIMWARYWVRGHEFVTFRFGYSLTLVGEIR